MPVRNEERDLGPSIGRLHRYVHGAFPFSARITIADNGSTDRTWALAVALSHKYPGVQAARLEEAGRGRALHAVWTASDAEVLAYMDVDMSTDLNALLPLVAPLLSGHSDLAIGQAGSRAAQESPAARAARSSPAATTCFCTPRLAPASPTPSTGSRRSAQTGRGCSCPWCRTGPGSSTQGFSCSPSVRACACTG